MQIFYVFFKRSQGDMTITVSQYFDTYLGSNRDSVMVKTIYLGDNACGTLEITNVVAQVAHESQRNMLRNAIGISAESVIGAVNYLQTGSTGTYTFTNASSITLKAGIYNASGGGSISAILRLTSGRITAF